MNPTPPDLLSLLLDLSDLNDPDTLLSSFLTKVGEALPRMNVRHVAAVDSASPDVIPLTASHKEFGGILLSPSSALSPEEEAELRRAARWLAVLLEKAHRHEQAAARCREQERIGGEKRMEPPPAGGQDRKTLERLIDRAQEIAPIGFWSLDLLRGRLEWSRGTEAIFGVKDNEFDGRRETFYRFVHPEDRERVAAAIQEVQANRTPCTIEYRIVGADQIPRWLSQLGEPILSDEGLPVRVVGVCRDITQQKKDEEALRISDKQFRALVQNIPNIAVQGYDRDRKVIFWNDASRALYGYSSEEALGRSLEDLIIPEFMRDGVIQCVRDWVERDIPIEAGELVLRHKNGSDVHVYSSHVMLRNIRGEHEMYCIDIDLSLLKQAEEELRKRNQFIETVLENMPIGLSVANAAEGVPSYMNRKFIEIHDWPREVLFDRNLFFENVFPDPQYRQSVFERIGKDMKSGDTRRMQWNDVEITTRHNTKKHLSLACIILKDQNLSIFVVEDVTAQRQSEEERRRLETAINQAGESIFITDNRGGIQFVNPAFEKLSGYDRSEILGRNPRLLKSGTHSQSFYRELWGTILRGDLWHGSLINKRKDGSLYEAETTLSAVKNSNGQIQNFVSISRDVTHERELEAQLRQAQKMEAVGRLAGGIAHDFNNLLTGILGYSQLAMSKLDPFHPLRQNLQEIIKAGERASSLTKQLLAFSRKQVLQPKVLDLNDLLTGLGSMMRRLIGEDVDLVADYQPGLDRIQADPGQIEQIVLNLVINARDAMPAGGRIVLETRNVLVDDEFRKTHMEACVGPHVQLAIRDTGHGMDGETLDKIFEPFFTTKDLGKGTGLGLSTVYGIVKQSGGFITVESQIDRGSSFFIYLPRVFDSVGPAEIGSPVALDSQPHHETILLVEDEDLVRNLVEDVLNRYGYTVLVAASGETALRWCETWENEIHLLLTDVILPGLNGRDTALQVREKRPDIRTLFISGYPNEIIPQHGVLGAQTYFLQKPFTLDALLRKIREVIEAK